MKNIFHYIILFAVIIIDIIVFTIGAIYILSLEATFPERLGLTMAYLFTCLIILILTADVVSWVERETHK